jgi:hypothetical protein
MEHFMEYPSSPHEYMMVYGAFLRACYGTFHGVYQWPPRIYGLSHNIWWFMVHSPEHTMEHFMKYTTSPPWIYMVSLVIYDGSWCIS